MTDENNQDKMPEEQNNTNTPIDEPVAEQSLEQNPEIAIEQIQEQPLEKPKKNHRKLIKTISITIAAIAVIGGVIYIISKANDDGWFSNQLLAFYIAAGLIVAGTIAWLILRKSLRTRLKMEKLLNADPDIDDFLVIYNLTPKALYFPTIAVSYLAALLLLIPGIDGTVIGGIWFAVFFLNFLIEEYNISIKISLIFLISMGFFLLWLHLLGKVTAFLDFFKNIAISMNAAVYLLVGILGLATIFISWIKGLFYYVTLTPNYINIQGGPTESGEQIGREDYNTRIDTSDILERIMGFGRIIISFKDKNKEPLSLLVWRIESKAEMLERVRGKLVIDYTNKKGNKEI